MNPPISYPPARREDLVETLHGAPVADPYRWLEDDHSPETSAWVAAQNQLTNAFLERIPARARYRQRLSEVWDYEQYGVPFKKGARWFFTYNPGLKNQSSLYWLDRLDGSPSLLLDPNTLSADGTVALSGVFVDRGGEFLAYSLSEAGSDWQEWRVRRVSTAEDLPDRVRWSKFCGASWASDGSGFYYSRYDAPSGQQTTFKEANYYHKVYFHRLGDAQDLDVLVYQRPDQKEWDFNADVTDDGRYLIIHVFHGTFQETAIFYQDLQTPGAAVVELLNQFDAAYQFIGNDGPLFYFLTNHSAPRYRVVAIDIRRPDPAAWREILREAPDTLEDAALVGDTLIARYLHHACHQVLLFDLRGEQRRALSLPGIGSVEGLHGSRADTHAFYKFSSFTNPGAVYRLDLQTGAAELFRQPTLAFNPADFTSEQVFYPSKDGTRIPMFLVYKNGLARDGQNKTYLYGYGGFNISAPPQFSPARIAWMESGGLLALPNLRGGGEYGAAWHEAGKLRHKQNVFDDFIAAAEWLISNGYTQTARLAIHGRSNGGLLTGACLTQRPDLFGAAIVSVGVLDMLRFHKWTIGWGWVSDYGSPDDPADFRYLLAYSPYHNIHPGAAYPPTLVTTGDHDDRVFPAHSFKFTAALQFAQAGPAPILIRIDVRAGHGAGKPTAMVIAETADIFAFIDAALQAV